jgi:hypothetical protein
MINNYAKTMGVILVLVGIFGFIPSLTPNGMLFGMFMVDSMHNIIHLVSGAIFLAAGFSDNWELCKRVTLLFAIVYGLVTLLGFISPDKVVLGMHMNMADNVLHLAITASALIFGLQPRYAVPR